MFESPYKILGVSEGASLEECKKAMRRLSRKYHPDLGGDANMFVKINKAYESIKSGEYEKQKSMSTFVPKQTMGCSFVDLFTIRAVPAN